ncbi:hypothetical protein GKC56_01405 [Neisseriaceae bacterium PsAf]|nr:hypothetical protein [Neisseriaceae bacterium PsAf]MCV2502873.1 hypothetical protein [Neisseriaceae bacterium]
MAVILIIISFYSLNKFGVSVKEFNNYHEEGLLILALCLAVFAITILILMIISIFIDIKKKGIVPSFLACIFLLPILLANLYLIFSIFAYTQELDSALPSLFVIATFSSVLSSFIGYFFNQLNMSFDGSSENRLESIAQEQKTNFETITAQLELIEQEQQKIRKELVYIKTKTSQGLINRLFKF